MLALVVLALACRALNVVSSYRSSDGGDSTLLELSFDQGDLPSSQAEGVLQFQVEGAAIGAGLRGLLQGTLTIAPPESIVERNLLGYVPEGSNTRTFSVCNQLQNEAQLAGASERESTLSEYSLQALYQQAPTKRRRRLQETSSEDVELCSGNGEEECKGLNAAFPGRYVCYVYNLMSKELFRFCIDSRMCLQGASDAPCMLGIAKCMAKAKLALINGAALGCPGPCRVGEYCAVPSSGTTSSPGVCLKIESTMGAPHTGDIPGAGNCYDDRLTEAISDKAQQDFKRAFSNGYKGLGDMQATLDKTAQIYNSALKNLEELGKNQTKTLQQLLLNLNTLTEQKEQVNETSQDFLRLEATINEFVRREAKAFKDFNETTGATFLELQTFSGLMNEETSAVNALFLALLAQSRLQSTLMGEFTVDLAGLLDMARDTLAEVRELQTSERSRRALAAMLFAYAEQAAERSGVHLLAEGGVPPLGFARVNDPSDPYWFRFTAVIQFEQDTLPDTLDPAQGYAGWALQDPEVRWNYETYTPTTADLNPSWLPTNEPLTPAEYWNKSSGNDVNEAGKFAKYADVLSQDYSVGSGMNRVRWLLLHTVRFFCDPQFLLEQSDNWFTFRDIMKLIGPAGCEPPELGTDTPRPDNACHCWLNISRSRCLRKPNLQPWAPATEEATLELTSDMCGDPVGWDVTDDFYGKWLPLGAREETITSDQQFAELLGVWCAAAVRSAPSDRIFFNSNLLELALQLEPDAVPRLGPWQTARQPSNEEYRYCSTHWADIESQTALLRRRSNLTNAATLQYLLFYSAQQATRFLRQREMTQVLIDVAGDLPDDVHLSQRPFFTRAPAALRAPQLPPALGDPAWTVPPEVANCDTLTAGFSTTRLLPLWQLRHVETRQTFTLQLKNLDSGLTFTQNLSLPVPHQLPAESVLVLGYLSCLHHWCGIRDNYSFVYDVLPEEVSGHTNQALRYTDYVMFFPENERGTVEQNRHLLFPLGCVAVADGCAAGGECVPHHLSNRATVQGETPAVFWKRQHLSARLEPTRLGRSPVDSRKRLLNGVPWQRRRCEQNGMPEGPLCQLLRTHWWPSLNFVGGETLDNVGCADGRFALRPLNWSSRLSFDVPGTSFARRDEVATWCPLDGTAVVEPRSPVAGEPGLRLRFRQGLDAGGGAARPMRLQVWRDNTTLFQSDLRYPTAQGLYYVDVPGTDGAAVAAAIANGTSGLWLRVLVGTQMSSPPALECLSVPLDNLASTQTVDSFFLASAAGGAGGVVGDTIEHMWLQMQTGAAGTGTAAALVAAMTAAATAALLANIANAGNATALAGLLNDWELELAALRAVLLSSFAQNEAYLRTSAANANALSQQLEATLNQTKQVMANFDSDVAAVQQEINNISVSDERLQNASAKWNQWSADVSSLGASLANGGLFQSVVSGYVRSTVPSEYVVAEIITVPAVGLPDNRRDPWQKVVRAFSDKRWDKFKTGTANFFKDVGEWVGKAVECAADIVTEMKYDCLAPNAKECVIRKPRILGMFCYKKGHMFHKCKSDYFRTDGTKDVIVFCDTKRAAWVVRYYVNYALLILIIVVVPLVTTAGLGYVSYWAYTKIQRAKLDKQKYELNRGKILEQQEKQKSRSKLKVNDEETKDLLSEAETSDDDGSQETQKPEQTFEKIQKLGQLFSSQRRRRLI